MGLFHVKWVNGLIQVKEIFVFPIFWSVFVTQSFSSIAKNREVVKIGMETYTTTDNFFCCYTADFLSSFSTTYHVWSCNVFERRFLT